jgi:hypothetical protein
VCGTPIKLENLEKHMKRVHPKEKVDLEYSGDESEELERAKVKEKRYTGTSSRTLYAIAAIIIVIIVVAAAMIYLPSEEQPSKTPSVQVSETSHDFGMADNPSTLTHDFTITNVGDGVLEISKIETTCVCTGATLIVDGESNGPYRGDEPGSPSSWKEQIYPGGSGTLRVDYDTLYFPDPQSGNVTRSIDVHTNDPSFSLLTFSVKADIRR